MIQVIIIILIILLYFYKFNKGLKAKKTLAELGLSKSDSLNNINFLRTGSYCLWNEKEYRLRSNGDKWLLLSKDKADKAKGFVRDKEGIYVMPLPKDVSDMYGVLTKGCYKETEIIIGAEIENKYLVTVESSDLGEKLGFYKNAHSNWQYWVSKNEVTQIREEQSDPKASIV